MLGKGSFGKVYRGYDYTTNNWVAIKQLELDLL
jgi:serine/threonine protein kinase